VGPGRYNVVQPYVNSATTTGLGNVYNTAYQNAQYQISYINHPMALEVKPFKPGQVNKMMGFMLRDYAGKWQFATNDLGANAAGVAIANYKKNKGKFFADFKLAIKPSHPEWLIPIFHLREGPCIYGVSTCNPSPGYPAQSYNSAPTLCPYIYQWVAVIDSTTNVYTIPANTLKLNGNFTGNPQFTGATIAALATAMNANAIAAAIGVWSVDSTGLNLQVTLPAGNTNNVELSFQDA
jgi:hypothetical protein